MAEVRLAKQFNDELERDELSIDPEDSVPASHAPRAPQLRRLGRYKLVREIASGGMASVNLAVTGGLDKLVALKMIHPHLAQQDSFVRMFLDEARIASSITHRNVCNTFDFGEAEGRYFIAMDYLAGHSLRDLLLRLRKQPAEAEPRRLSAYMAYILAEACEGLHAAHELCDAQGTLLQVVHRDVSPHNLFITYDGNVSVVDFGIARAEGRLQHTATGVLKGKFSYMAPEQVRQLDVDRRADIWSLGVCLWEGVTLERLFVRSSQADTLMSVMMDKVRPPSEVRPEVPKSIDAIAQKALSRNPNQRYASAREMGRDLMQVVRDSGVLVGPVELEDWLQRLFPRERESARALTRFAKQSALDDSSSTWTESIPAATATAPTRSGLVAKVSVPHVEAITYSGVPLSPASCDEISMSSNLERLISQPVKAEPSLFARHRGVLFGTVIGLTAAVALGLALLGERTLLSSREPSTSGHATTPASAFVKEPVTAPPAPVMPAPAALAPQPLLPVAVLERPAPSAGPSAAAKGQVEQPKRLPEGRRAKSDNGNHADASRGAPATKPAVPEAREPVSAESVQPPAVAERVPNVPAPATEPAPTPIASAPQAAAAPAAPAPRSQPVAVKPAERLEAHAAVGALDVEGSLGSGVVARMLSRAAPLLHDCYGNAARRAGRNDFSALNASLSIDETGAVRSVETSPHPLSGLSRCIGDALERLRSERKPDVGTVRARLQITFKPE